MNDLSHVRDSWWLASLGNTLIWARLRIREAGTAEVLGGDLGSVDLFDLRPRIGFASTTIARRIPPKEKVVDVVLTAAYSVTGRWNEEYENVDVRRAHRVLV